MVFPKLLVLMATLASIECGIFKCIQTKSCSCSSIQSKYEFQCPFDNPDVVFQVQPNYELNFQFYNKSKWDLDLLPNLEIGNVEYFMFRMCPVPDSFEAIIKKFGITKIKTLRFDYSYGFANKTLTRDFFKGVWEIEELQLDDNDIKLVAEDAFDDLSNLKELDLRSNRIILQPTMFKNLKQLEWLDLSENKLTYIPEGLFDNLTNLKNLHMWRNELTNLNGQLFKNLINLKSLNLRFNNLTKIDETMLMYLSDLVEIDLMANNITYLSPTVFLNNPNLKIVYLKRNPNLDSLPSGLFSNLNELDGVDISENNLRTLPNDLFHNSSNISRINVAKNNLESIPTDIFKGLEKLEELDLSYNKLNSISSDSLKYLGELKTLQVSHNYLTNITEDMFYYLKNLEKLDLEFNAIETIHVQAFQKNGNLRIIRIGHNLLTLETFPTIWEISPFNFCLKLEELYINNNLLERFFDDWLQSKIYIKTIDAKFNHIKSISFQQIQKVTNGKVTIDLRYNNITEVDLDHLELIAKNQDQPLDAVSYSNDVTVLYLDGNPLDCDCGAYNLARYVEGSMDPKARSLLEIVIDNVTCNTPKHLLGYPVALLSSKKLSCSFEQVLGSSKNCPDTCNCAFRMWDKSLIYDCSYRNLSTAPALVLPSEKFYVRTEVHLEGNQLTNGPEIGMGYENVTKLYLSDNKIEELDWLPSKIEVLHIDYNNISFLDYEILTILNSTTVKNISLHHNPWKCECRASNFTDFLRDNLYLKQDNPSEVKCADSGKPLINLNRKNLCPTYLPLILGSSLSLLVFLFLIAVSVALYYRYQQEIKVWLFAHDLLLRFITEEEIDKDKSYDAFISYSHKDEDFVTEKLLPVLEDGPHPYKLCLHYRDWIPGEFISKQIVQSVENSRRTVVILSKSFLESVWGKMEFRTAHTQAMSEGRARVIIILYGDIGPDDVDEELKAYLKTNTYLKWGDPWFWNKMRYALPHSPHKTLDKKKTQRNNNIMLSLNDKLDLITAPTTPNPGSTPPAVSLDPLLIKTNPLEFGMKEIKNTIPAEA